MMKNSKRKYAESMPDKPRIVLLANDRVGLEVARYLKKEKVNIVALVVHPAENAKLAEEIKTTVKPDLIFNASQLKREKCLQRIRGLNPNVAISAWFGYIVKKNFIDIFPFGCVNLHNSYLPYGRGKYPHVWALYEGSLYGVTLHYMDDSVDTGDIIVQKKVPIQETDIAGTLYERSLDAVVQLFCENWHRIKSGETTPRPQDESIATAHKAKEVERLNVIEADKLYRGEELINQLRARSFQDRTYTYIVKDGKKIYIKIELSEAPDFNE